MTGPQAARDDSYIAAPPSRNAPDGEPGGTIGSGAQQLPVPGVPPDAVHASADGRNEHDVSVQSASATQDAPSAHAPATHADAVAVVQLTKPSARPHVERAAQRCDALRQRRLTAPAEAAIAALFAFATQRTY